MKIVVHAKPGARETKIDSIGEHEFVISVKEPPIKGKANQAIMKVIAEYFSVSPGMVRIVSGAASRRKIIEIV